jgi:hypothetical protein
MKVTHRADLEYPRAGVPFAIGMAASVGDADAITFATRFLPCRRQ